MDKNEKSVPRVVDLAGAIAAFERLSREAFSHDPHSFSGLFLLQTADSLREVQAGRAMDEAEWLRSLEEARLVSEICDGGLHV